MVGDLVYDLFPVILSTQGGGKRRGLKEED